MSDPKVTAAHLRRTAAVYCRQSTLIQVERNRESTLRQYDLVSRAGALGWARSAIRVIDTDLGVSGSGLAARAGFTELTEQIALGQVGVVLALEVSRLARSSAEWYRLLDLCGITDTLIADEASVYYPGMFDDRLLLGLKGTMAEAELQVLRARMLGGLRNKAGRGELRIPLPAGLVWGEAPGQILLHPDEAVRGAITAVFDRFAASGSARQTWLWLRENGLKLPSVRDGQLAWSTAAYPAVHKILTHPAYAGAYVYGRTRAERYIDESGTPAGKRRVVPRPEDWQVLITGHHPGYIGWDTYLASTARLAANMAPVRGADGTGATREGCALLQGLAICGICGRRLGVFYRGPARSIPGYQCNGGVLVGGGQGRFCTRVSGLRTDPAVAQHVLEILTPLALQAAIRRRRPTRGRTRRRPRSMAPPSRAGPLRRHPGRAALPRRRPGKPAGRPRPGSRMGSRPAGHPRRRRRAGPPRSGPARPAQRRRAGQDPRHRRRPSCPMVRAVDHRPRPQGTPARPPRRHRHHRRCGLPHRPPGAALEGRADQPDQRGPAQAQAAISPARKRCR